MCVPDSCELVNKFLSLVTVGVIRIYYAVYTRIDSISVFFTMDFLIAGKISHLYNSKSTLIVFL